MLALHLSTNVLTGAHVVLSEENLSHVHLYIPKIIRDYDELQISEWVAFFYTHTHSVEERGAERWVAWEFMTSSSARSTLVPWESDSPGLTAALLLDQNILHLAKYKQRMCAHHLNFNFVSSYINKYTAAAHRAATRIYDSIGIPRIRR